MNAKDNLKFERHNDRNMVPPSIGRLARFTLYSGPNCSLCDVRLSWAVLCEVSLMITRQVAKGELAKVREARPFTLDVVNIQVRSDSFCVYHRD